MKITYILRQLPTEFWVGFFAFILSVIASTISYQTGVMIAYGDAESHLNIAKRVTHSLTPGLAQLGGIWLPLPHLMMLPFTFIDTLWRTGIAGAIISGLSFITTSVYLYKLSFAFTQKLFPSLIAPLLFMANPNILYMQTTAMSELPLIMFFVVSTYYFVRFLQDDSRVGYLLVSALFGFFSTLTRYDGWFLVFTELVILFVYFVWKSIRENVSFKQQLRKLEGLSIIFATLGLVGIVLWIGWDFLILGDPLYFTNSPFSAKSQQQGWLSKGMLLTYQNAPLSFQYYLLTSIDNIGRVLSVLAGSGIFFFLIFRPSIQKALTVLLLFVPFIFYFVTLFMGQSVIFIPQLTPDNFEWQLFNVRYGLMMIPAAVFFISYLALLFSKNKYLLILGSVCILLIASFQTHRFISGTEEVITLKDGVSGLSAASTSDAQEFLKNEYDSGLVLIDDYARTTSIIKTGIPMQNTIYIGNQPYWEESLENPEKHAEWVVMQQNDAVWNALFADRRKQADLYKYYQKVYTSNEILIFKRI